MMEQNRKDSCIVILGLTRHNILSTEDALEISFLLAEVLKEKGFFPTSDTDHKVLIAPGKAGQLLYLLITPRLPDKFQPEEDPKEPIDENLDQEPPSDEFNIDDFLGGGSA